MSAVTPDDLWETYKQTRANGRYPLTTYSRSQEAAFRAAIELTKTVQLDTGNLTDIEYLEELRKGPQSIYWPVMAGDPTFPANCHGCGRQRIFDSRGVCDVCGWELG